METISEPALIRRHFLAEGSDGRPRYLNPAFRALAVGSNDNVATDPSAAYMAYLLGGRKGQVRILDRQIRGHDAAHDRRIREGIQKRGMRPDELEQLREVFGQFGNMAGYRLDLRRLKQRLQARNGPLVLKQPKLIPGDALQAPSEEQRADVVLDRVTNQFILEGGLETIPAEKLLEPHWQRVRPGGVLILMFNSDLPRPGRDALHHFEKFRMLFRQHGIRFDEHQLTAQGKHQWYDIGGERFQGSCELALVAYKPKRATGTARP